MKILKYSLLLSAVALAAGVSAAPGPMKDSNHAFVGVRLGYMGL